MPKQKFKDGVAPVPGKPGKWDVNYRIRPANPSGVRIKIS